MAAGYGAVPGGGRPGSHRPHAGPLLQSAGQHPQAEETHRNRQVSCNIYAYSAILKLNGWIHNNDLIFFFVCLDLTSL